MRKAKEIVHNNFMRRFFYEDSDEVRERDLLLQRMGCFKKKTRDIPVLIENDVEQVINPWLAYKFVCEIGLPSEVFFKEIEDELGYKKEEYWSDWCDFWFKDFKEANHRLLFDSKWMINSEIDNDLKDYSKKIDIYEALLKYKL